MISQPSEPAGAPILCFVVDGRERVEPAPSVVEAAVRGGVDWVQIRDRSLEAASLLRLSREILAAARRGAPARPVRVIVNRRLDVALSIGADGVHLGFDAVSPDAVRSLLGRELPVGISTHRAQEVGEALRTGAHYVHLAPIFEPLSKDAERPALGIAGLEKALDFDIPVLGQGGIDASNCGDVIRAGAAGVAVTGAISLARDPGAAAAELRSALDAASGEPAA